MPHFSSRRAFSATHLIFTAAPRPWELILPILQMKKEYKQIEFPFHPEAALAKPSDFNKRKKQRKLLLRLSLGLA